MAMAQQLHALNNMPDFCLSDVAYMRDIVFAGDVAGVQLCFRSRDLFES